MNSYFQKVLSMNQLLKHDGRNLFNYGLTENDYSELKDHLSTVDANNFDPRDITLFFAEWWKNEYDGGTPSIESVYKMIADCKFELDDFFRYAKRGAVILGINWIRLNNLLKFRTLLLQGGIPIKHVLNNSGIYTDFLKRVIESNPNSIEEFSYDSDLIRILPKSSRNNAVYESCLQISKAIWNGDDKYLQIFENRSNERTSFKEITDALKVHKQNIEEKFKRQTSFKSYWVLDTSKESNNIFLDFNFPKTVSEEELAGFINSDISILKHEYYLFINAIPVHRFSRNLAGNYNILKRNDSRIYWDQEHTISSVSIKSKDGTESKFPMLNVYSLSFDQPTLWVQNSDNEFVFQQGKNCREERALVIFNNDWFADNDQDVKKLCINNVELNICEFEGELIVKNNDGEKITFKTNVNSFSWYFSENKPNWMVKSNIKCVNEFPNIVVYDKNNDIIRGRKVLWRKAGDALWNENKTNIPLGLIEYKIIANDAEEIDYFYNIGNLNLSINSTSPNLAEIEILNKKNLIFEIFEAENLEI